VVLTQAATVLLEDKVVVTDRPVRIEMGPNTLTGVGMRMDSQSRQLQVDSRVRGHIAPRDGAPGAPPGHPPGDGR
jgi:LPS export ABC transporter protein LptC